MEKLDIFQLSMGEGSLFSHVRPFYVRENLICFRSNPARYFDYGVHESKVSTPLTMHCVQGYGYQLATMTINSCYPYVTTTTYGDVVLSTQPG